MKNKKIRSQRRNKLKQFLLIAAGVIIAGGIFIGGWALGAGSPLQESGTSPTETASAGRENPETSVPMASPTTELPPSSYLPEVPRISIEEVKAKLDAGSNMVIIDTRPKTSYDLSHIAGAISIPFTDMAEPYSDLASYDEIITYCD